MSDVEMEALETEIKETQERLSSLRKEYKEKKRVSYKGNTPAFQAGDVGSIPSTRSTSSIKEEALDIYRNKGYHQAVSDVDNMYSTGSITLMQKCNINSFLAGIAVMNKKEQRLILNALS